ncbi:MAG: lipocalin-like domain-containing protein [Bacteroidaceae bacterium]|nr:lipocalin-like domain-containing protein [Bacteroidaceae bacterium]
MKRFLYITALSMLTLAVCSGCMEKAFPDDDLDFYWRLDRIEYRDGKDFQGQPCQSKDVDNIMFGFARHIVLIEAPGLSQQHGITTETGDSIKLDYSIYNNPALKDRLQDCGLDSVVSVFRIEYPDRQRMVLSGKKTVLRFRKW